MKGKSVLFGVLLALSWGIAPSAFAQDHELEITLEVFDDIDDIREFDAGLLAVEVADGDSDEDRIDGDGGSDEPDGRGEDGQDRCADGGDFEEERRDLDDAPNVEDNDEHPEGDLEDSIARAGENHEPLEPVLDGVVDGVVDGVAMETDEAAEREIDGQSEEDIADQDVAGEDTPDGDIIEAALADPELADPELADRELIDESDAV